MRTVPELELIQESLLEVVEGMELLEVEEFADVMNCLPPFFHGRMVDTIARNRDAGAKRRDESAAAMAQVRERFSPAFDIAHAALEAALKATDKVRSELANNPAIKGGGEYP